MPRVQTTPMVKVALWGLRIYLIVLLSIILLSFIRKVQSEKAAPAPADTKAQ
jgi:hypothetical protein